MKMHFAVLLLGLTSLAGNAVEPGRLQGVVRDGSSAVIRGAQVSLLEENTGFQYSTTTDEAGEFRLTLPGGRYNVVVRRLGFRHASRLGIVVPAAGVQSIEIGLQPATVFDSVTVVEIVGSGTVASRPGSTFVRPDELASLPRNDRTVTGLTRFVPGLLVTPANNGEPGQVSSLGSRPNANLYVVDGLAANNCVAGGGWPSFLAGSSLPSMSALGTTHTLAMPGAIEEVSLTPEPPTAAGASISIQTSKGGEQLHGFAESAFRAARLGANDWFSNSYNLGRTAPRLRDFSAAAGGPLLHGRTYFFLAAERLDLHQAYSWITTVPSLGARLLAPPSLQPLLRQFPLPNGPELPGLGIAELWGSSMLPAGLSAGSARLDHAISPRTKAFVRFAFTPSWSETGFQQVDAAHYRDQVGALGLTRGGTRWTHDLRLGFHRTSAESRWRNSGSVSPSSDFYSQFPSLAADFASVSVGGAGSISVGENGRNRQDLLQAVVNTVLHTSRHEMRAGFAFLELRPSRSGPAQGVNIAYSTPTDLVNGPATPVWVTYSEVEMHRLSLNQLSGFVQDSWKPAERLRISLGLRWSQARAPRFLSGPHPLYSVANSTAETTATPILSGTPLWSGAEHFDPAISLAWQPFAKHATVIRAALTTFHDPGTTVAMSLLNSVPVRALRTPPGAQPYSFELETVPIGFGYASDLRPPRVERWSVALEQNWERRGAVELAYSGMTASRLLRMETVIRHTPQFEQLAYVSSHGNSWFEGLNAAYRLPFAARFQARITYQWSHSIDLGSSDTALYLAGPGTSPWRDRGDSDFDVRQVFGGALSFVTPAHVPLHHVAGNWTLGTFVSARTAFPLDVLSSETFQGFAIANLRPDLVPGVALKISDPEMPGGYALNKAAFAMTGSTQGGLGRNSVRGFGMWQADVAATRDWRLARGLRFTFRAEAFNIANHPFFADPMRYLSNPMFGRSGSSLNLMMGSGSPNSGQSPVFQQGCPRSIQLSFRLSF